MEERSHATTQNRFYPDISNVNKNITVEAKLSIPPTYMLLLPEIQKGKFWETLNDNVCGLRASDNETHMIFRKVRNKVGSNTRSHSARNVFSLFFRIFVSSMLHNIILNSLLQHNHFIIRGNYKATCFDYWLVILKPILPIMSQDAMHTVGSHRVYIHGIHQIKSSVSTGVTCKLCLQQWDT